MNNPNGQPADSELPKRPKTKAEEIMALRELCAKQRKMLVATMATNTQLKAQLLALTIDSKDKQFLVETVANEIMARFGFDMSKIDQSYLKDVKPAELAKEPEAQPEEPKKRFTKQYGKN